MSKPEHFVFQGPQKWFSMSTPFGAAAQMKHHLGQWKKWIAHLSRFPCSLGSSGWDPGCYEERSHWVQDRSDRHIKRSKGGKCRGMGWAVLLKQREPELMNKISIMSQPASNMDSITLSWVIEDQIRNYFCALFSDEIRLAQYIGGPVSSEIFLSNWPKDSKWQTQIMQRVSRFRSSLEETRSQRRRSQEQHINLPSSIMKRATEGWIAENADLVPRCQRSGSLFLGMLGGFVNLRNDFLMMFEG